METWQQFVERKGVQWEKEKNKEIRVKDVGRKAWHVTRREAWTFVPQSNLSKKVFSLERLRKLRVEGKTAHEYSHEEKVVYRIGYWIVGKHGHLKNKWAWGQFCPMISGKDLARLMRLAEKEGTLIK